MFVLNFTSHKRSLKKFKSNPVYSEKRINDIYFKLHSHFSSVLTTATAK